MATAELEKKSRPPRKARETKPKAVVVEVVKKGKKSAPPAKKAVKAKVEPPKKKGKTPEAKKGKDPEAKKGKVTPKGKKAPAKGKKDTKKKEVKKPKTAEELDREMDDYMLKDEKTALKKLDEDMDSYKAQAKKKDDKPVAVEASA